MDYLTPENVQSKIEWTETVLGIDPGKMTGLAILTPHSIEFETLPYTAFLDKVGCWHRSRIVYVTEQFIVRPCSFAQNQEAPMLNGAIEAASRWFPHKTLVYQSPQLIKTMLPDLASIRKAGWKWKTRHEADALRHAIYYLLTRGSKQPSPVTEGIAGRSSPSGG